MPKETDRLKLPLPLGNETVSRESINGIFEKIDAGVATQADLETLREAVSKMDIPDASLTQKGKVQLSSKTDGTSETVAATEKAVRDARVTAINVATTDATANAKSYIDTKTWQKHKLTADDGKSQLISGTDLNSLVANGQYNGNSLTNAPIPANVDEWWYIDVQCHSNGLGYVIQRASRLNGGTQTLYQRTRENNIWQPWSLDVFQSVSDGKKAIAAAITGKGVAASGSETFGSLTTKISQISSDLKNISGNTGIAVNNEQGYNGKEVTSTLLDFVPKIVTVNLETSYRNSNSYDSGSFKAGASLKFDSRTNTFPSSWISSEGLWGGSGAKFSFSISVGWNTTSRTLRISITDEVGYNPKYITVGWSVYGL
ncbi:tail fiber protein [Paenibacillus pabuli]|uniref:pyocin knob domain-containing protein n=1 Tax=Paenibacillus pabuli TaxID=1472 RepID=UPI003CE6B6A7